MERKIANKIDDLTHPGETKTEKFVRKTKNFANDVKDDIKDAFEDAKDKILNN